MRKNKQGCVRFNMKLMEELKEKGWSVQKIFDLGMEQIVEVKTKHSVKIKRENKPLHKKPM